MNSEPVLILMAIAALINLAVGFGLTLTVQQVELLNVAITAVVAAIIRQHVTPVGK